LPDERIELAIIPHARIARAEALVLSQILPAHNLEEAMGKTIRISANR
jgi:hypothetical protein